MSSEVHDFVMKYPLFSHHDHHCHFKEFEEKCLDYDAASLLGYADAAYERAKTYLAGMTPKDLDRVLDEPQYDPLPTVGVRLVSVVSDNTQHAGQIGYLRGYHAGFGWQPAR